jgi:hypothetical protein
VFWKPLTLPDYRNVHLGLSIKAYFHREKLNFLLRQVCHPLK